MSKPFFEVFPALKLNQATHDILEQAQVEKVSATKRRDFLRIYLFSTRLILKPDIRTAEREIKKQLFPQANLTVKIYERFELSSQYTPEKLLELYRDSILEELKEYSHIEYNAFRTAELDYPKEGQLLLTLEDSVLVRSKESELVRVLEKVLVERCGLSLSVLVDYREAQESKYEADEALKIQMRVAEISSRLRRTQGAGTSRGGQETGAFQGSQGTGAYQEDQGAGAYQGDQGTGASQSGQGMGAFQSGQGMGASQGDQGMGASQSGQGAGAYQSGAAAEGRGADRAGRSAAQKGASATFAGGAKKGGVLMGGAAGSFSGAGEFRRGEYKRGEFRKSEFGRGALKRSDNPDVIYGRDFEEDAMKIEELIGEMGEVVIHGKVLKVDKRGIKNEKTIVIFDMTDFTDTMTVKLFLRNEQVDELTKELKEGAFIKVKGICMVDKFDHELTIGSLAGIKKIPDFTVKRQDTALHKRVELHCHTKMSEMDGVSEAKDIVKCAYKWGHRAIAITDHGVVQSFTDAGHVWDDLWKAEQAKRREAGEETPDKQDFFKILYGVEAYLVDDLKEIVTGDKGQDLTQDFVVFDIETTGFSPVNNRMIEIGAVKVSAGKIVDRFSTFVNPETPIPFEIEKLTGINDEMVMEAPKIEEILPQFLEFSAGCVMVAHNAGFDMSFLIENCKRQGIAREFTSVDTLGIARVLLPNQAKHTLDAVAKTLGISLENHHRAVDDAECTAEIFVKFIGRMEKRGVHTLKEINAMGEESVSAIAKLPSYHAIILAKNDMGRINLYRLVSESHLKYFNKRPKIPKSLILKYREGLILGSACEAGELYRALLDGQSDAQIARIVSFYDYLEIQPCGNNQFMIASEKIRAVNSLEDIQNLNKKIVALGEQFHKPVVATCDVHFLNPEDEIYRRIIMDGRGFEDADKQAPLYLHTTEEMLEEFAYLGSDKAWEVVVQNTNMIADMIETIAPVRPDKCAPVIPDSDKTLTDICYNKAHEIYGEHLPKIVEERLERELNSIISNGFAVMYIIAQKLVWKSVEDGYLVGSRGSVGSSFVATMSGITEVNPLSPHYYCSKCHYVDFDSEEVKAYAGKAGIDMPDKLCPVCGEPLHKDGFDIPFETFLGFKGDKEPDIDLNFSGEYQSKAHKYTEVIFGAGQTFRAGTIGTIADKTAFGYVKKYYEGREIHKRNSEVERLAVGCTGVRKNTGQHPGGIIVLPIGQDINSFTPVQHPANDMTTDTVTTHFDYHSIDHNLLKLDILGHDDPTMIRMLQDMTGREPTTIPLDGKDVMSLFQNTDALGITPDQIGGCKLGALGIPEFGTDFAMQMLLDTKPQAFSDLVRIAGLAHGTDVWLGNAQTLIQEGKATISTAICTRDDIMTYLIQMGVESEKAFKIMEAVRKGTVAKGKCDKWTEWKKDMEDHNVPDWYIWSCEKIKYMFPKAHAAAYVMMAWRIAYCKIHYPLAYYGAFFSIRAKAFSYEIMCQGQAHLERIMADYKKRMDTLSNREKDAYGDMRVVQEMYARGFEFEPIDIFRAQSRAFQIIDGKLMPSLSSIEGLGDKAADAIVEATKDGPFLSKEDFIQRTKVSKTIADLMGTLGLLGKLPESNQISIFDFV
ncbi:MAG: PolC-type DNA polymerase III [Candidatus Gastranaerophilales bacterium]|nr:PolC-type DNA polymerase III [Candidatus Gastranaerophilales bacterium]